MFVLLLGRWLGGIIRKGREPSPTPSNRAQKDFRESSTDSNVVYFLEEMATTSTDKSAETSSNHSSGMLADSRYDTPASSPVQISRNFFDNSFQHPFLDLLDQEGADDELDANESYFDTLNCSDAGPENSSSCDLFFEKAPKTVAAFVDGICPLREVESLFADCTSSSFEEIGCEKAIRLTSQSEFNEVKWPDVQHEDALKNTTRSTDIQTSIDLLLNHELLHSSATTTFLKQCCNIALDANQAAHVELLKEDELSPFPSIPPVLSSTSSFSSSSSDFSDSDSSSSQSNDSV